MVTLLQQKNFGPNVIYFVCGTLLIVARLIYSRAAASLWVALPVDVGTPGPPPGPPWVPPRGSVAKCPKPSTNVRYTNGIHQEDSNTLDRSERVGGLFVTWSHLVILFETWSYFLIRISHVQKHVPERFRIVLQSVLKTIDTQKPKPIRGDQMLKCFSRAARCFVVGTK